MSMELELVIYYSLAAIAGALYLAILIYAFK